MAVGFLTFAIASLFSFASLAETGVSRGEVLLGTSTNLEGATIGIAEEFNSGLEAFFVKINKTGGVHGRKIRRIELNDAYVPERTIENTRRLIEKEKVFALIGYASTPGVNAILPLINEKKIPLIAPYSGSESLRRSQERHVFNIKSGYQDQIEPLMKLAVYSLDQKEVCAFYQDDSLGQAATASAQNMLEKYNLRFRALAKYERNTNEVDKAVRQLSSAGCKTVFMAAKDRQALNFVKVANAIGFHPYYLCLSLVGTEEFTLGVKELNEKIYVTAVTPLPSDTMYAVAKEFKNELATLNPRAKQTPCTFEGYLAGAVFTRVLKMAGPEPTRASFERAFESLKDTDIGGLKFTFNKANRQAANTLLLTKVENGQLVPLP
jgi:branched-chain amino acid transport system substrate-binding protein